MVKIDSLEWDSDLFGYKVGKVVWNDSQCSSLESGIEECKYYRLIYIFSDTRLCFSASNIYEVDQKVTLEKIINFDEKELHDFNSCSSYVSGVDDYSVLESLAFESGKFSRFKIDNRFCDFEFEKLYREWIKKSINKEIADEIFVYSVDKKISGFITVSSDEKIGSIGLIAVSPSYQGKGIGSILIKCVEKYLWEKGIKVLQVPTQKRNEMAIRLYLKNGFNVKNMVYIYHYWND